MAKRNIERPYASGTWTRARMFSFIRSALRAASMKWPPRRDVLAEARVPYSGPIKNRKWSYICSMCHGEFAGKEIQVHHLDPVGALNSFDDLPGFTERLFCEKDKLAVTCIACHESITHETEPVYEQA